jgi:hypothetical protein
MLRARPSWSPLPEGEEGCRSTHARGGAKQCHRGGRSCGADAPRCSQVFRGVPGCSREAPADVQNNATAPSHFARRSLPKTFQEDCTRADALSNRFRPRRHLRVISLTDAGSGRDNAKQCHHAEHRRRRGRFQTLFRQNLRLGYVRPQVRWIAARQRASATVFPCSPPRFGYTSAAGGSEARRAAGSNGPGGCRSSRTPLSYCCQQSARDTRAVDSPSAEFGVESADHSRVIG